MIYDQDLLAMLYAHRSGMREVTPPSQEMHPA
jgi:hypothetical protein